MKLLKKIIKNTFLMLPINIRCRVHAALIGRKVALGQGSYIHPSVQLLGCAGIEIGSNTCISEGSWLNVNHIFAGRPAIQIQDNCFIGKDNFFSSGKKITIGSYTLTTNRCQFIGSSHNIHDPNIPYLLSGTTSEDQIIIGTNCFFGANSSVLGNVSVGHGSVVGANAVVQSSVPPFSIAVGNPAKVIKRFSFSKNIWLNISEFSKVDEQLLPDEQTYLKHLKNQFPRIGIPWIAAGRNMGNL